MVRLSYSFSIFALVTSLIAAQGNPNGPPPYYTPKWYLEIQSELGKQLSKDAVVMLGNDTRWAAATERWTPWSRPETIANVEAATVDDVKNVVSLSQNVLMGPIYCATLTGVSDRFRVGELCDEE